MKTRRAESVPVNPCPLGQLRRRQCVAAERSSCYAAPGAAGVAMDAVVSAFGRCSGTGVASAK